MQNCVLEDAIACRRSAEQRKEARKAWKCVVIRFRWGMACGRVSCSLFSMSGVVPRWGGGAGQHKESHWREELRAPYLRRHWGETRGFLAVPHPKCFFGI